MNNVIEFLKVNEIPYKNINLYLEAITHPSFSNEKRDASSYQRLEFLGDALLEAFTTEFVFNQFRKLDEGEMTIIRSSAVSGSIISTFAKSLKLDQLIRFGNNKKDAEALRNSEKILADIFESFVAAIYLDLGKEEVLKFLEKNVFKFVIESKNKELKNPKTILQELLQSYSREIIEYKTTAKNNGFESTIYHDGHAFGTGFGQTKKEAEVKAAENSLKLLKK